jgi:toxin ParE1/3/4
LEQTQASARFSVSQPLPIRYTVEAESDLDKIWVDLATARGDNFADQYMQRLMATIESLGQNPQRYNVRLRLGKGRRLMPEQPYHVIYRVDPDGVLIVRILHGRRKITRRSIET